MTTEVYLVWSNEHRAWWQAGGYGYSFGLNQAGRFTRDQALAICRKAIPTAAHLGAIAEIPVRLSDVNEFLDKAVVPRPIFEGRE